MSKDISKPGKYKTVVSCEPFDRKQGVDIYLIILSDGTEATSLSEFKVGEAAQAFLSKDGHIKLKRLDT